MNANKLFSEFSIKKIWDKLLQHDQAMSSTLLILSSGNWIEQADGTFKNTVSYSTFKDTDKLTVDLYDDGSLTETQLNEYEQYIDEFEIVNGALVATANTKPTQTMTVVLKGDFEFANTDLATMLDRFYKESNFTLAAKAIGNALVAKGIDVPDGTSLLEMADIISNIGSLSPMITIYYQVDQGEQYSEQFARDDYILAPPSFTPTKEGWTFIGWRKDMDASRDVLKSEIAESSIALYAVFKQDIKVNYNSNDSNNTTIENTETRYYNNGNIVNPTITLLENSFTRQYCSFVNWRRDNKDNGAGYDVGASVELTENTTFYAHWFMTLSGSAYYNVSANHGAGETYTYSFAVPFKTAPHIDYSKSSIDGDITTTIYNITTKSFTANFAHTKSAGQGCGFVWEATGEPA